MSDTVHLNDWWSHVPDWLGRALQPGDGLPAAEVDAAVARLAAQGFAVPPALRQLHLRLGRCAPLMQHFNRFLAPADWQLDQGRLVFLDENQGVCVWQVDADGQVWMGVDDTVHPEALRLDDFLAVLMPYQLAQGGWPCCADTVLPAAELTDEREAIARELGWPLWVRHNGLTLNGQGAAMLWSLDPAPGDTDAHLFISCLRPDDLEALCERFGFAEL
ncbi:hypothetical protein CCO03_02320 [Comamonas serinivorans]|uniref:Knr4/Smi1-like domain-containing protein n=1 Tax=Comamonas serinivorans TaxID=1082851 RepID=A0A1Y0EJ65_9BURK|nr:hypothetical protein [Comamonas serinivorans]ARU03675.1 hypothetical protein CCO03_02320 [Comamonas serinivorans]